MTEATSRHNPTITRDRTHRHLVLRVRLLHQGAFQRFAGASVALSQLVVHLVGGLHTASQKPPSALKNSHLGGHAAGDAVVEEIRNVVDDSERN